MTDGEIETLALKHVAPYYGRFLGKNTPYQQTEQFRRVKALISDVLSKLRAEGDERATFVVTADMIRLARDAYDKAEFPELNKWKRAIHAALASASVAEPWPLEEQPDGTLTPVDPADMESAPVADEPEKFEAWWASEIAANGGATIGADYRHWAFRGWLASAPVAGEAVTMKEICPVCGHQFQCFHNPYINQLRAAPQASEAPNNLQGLVEEAISWLETDGGRADSLCADLRKALAASKQEK